MKPHWSGVFPAITTQLNRDGSLDLDGTARHIEVLLRSGVAGTVMLGSLGENQPLDPLWNPSGYLRNVVETTKVNVA
ncbi:MAG: dihydrodipicolinate synthase family protein [Chthoniobacter sp.]|nr:dihydrodipicolinate synthase family protein [Chthoniobacter sp.]